jgi:hypothetical protein
VEVDTHEVVEAEIARLPEVQMVTEKQTGITCCFATQNKVWVTGPDGERWEIYTVLADSDTFGASPDGLAEHSRSVGRGGTTDDRAEAEVARSCC